MRITEVKHHLDGRVERFDCELLLRKPYAAIVRFEHRRSSRSGGFAIPKGSYTYGFFWPRRPYVLYRIIDPRGEVIAHRFDVVANMRLRKTEISYMDLLLDLWIGPDGRTRLEDEDEVREYVRRRRLTAAQRGRIGHARGLLFRSHPRIVREAAFLLDRTLN